MQQKVPSDRLYQLCCRSLYLNQGPVTLAKRLCDEFCNIPMVTRLNGLERPV